jgi:hypothetical protein
MKKEYKPANAEFRECVLMHKLGQINLPRFTGIPSPDDMAYEPTPLGYRSTYLYHHNVVAASDEWTCAGPLRHGLWKKMVPGDTRCHR